MHLFPDLKRRYTSERLSAREAQRQAEFIAWGPIVFQVSRLMLKFGILDMLRDSSDGLTEAEVAERTELSQYAVKCLLEASLSIGTVLIDTDTDRFCLSKTGWFLLNDPATKVFRRYNGALVLEHPRILTKIGVIPANHPIFTFYIFYIFDYSSGNGSFSSSSLHIREKVLFGIRTGL